MRAEATSKSGKPIENITTMYLPLVPRGSLVENWDPENLLKNLAPVCNCNNMHYENTDIDSENGKTENVDNEIRENHEN